MFELGVQGKKKQGRLPQKLTPPREQREEREGRGASSGGLLPPLDQTHLGRNIDGES
jgi:hypothetical protein